MSVGFRSTAHKACV